MTHMSLIFEKLSVHPVYRVRADSAPAIQYHHRVEVQPSQLESSSKHQSALFDHNETNLFKSFQYKKIKHINKKLKWFKKQLKQSNQPRQQAIKTLVHSVKHSKSVHIAEKKIFDFERLDRVATKFLELIKTYHPTKNTKAIRLDKLQNIINESYELYVQSNQDSQSTEFIVNKIHQEIDELKQQVIDEHQQSSCFTLFGIQSKFALSIKTILLEDKQAEDFRICHK